MNPTADINALTARRIDEWKQRLIDLTRRNRLLYFQPSKSNSLTISKPDCQTVFSHLYEKEKTWLFWLPPERKDSAAASAAENPDAELFETEGDDFGDGQLEELFDDQAPAPGELICENVSRKQLISKLKSLFRKAKTDYQERGVRVLYLAFGTLVWSDSNSPSSRLGNNITPLILCPVDLWRESAAEPFKLSWAEEDLVLNPALATKLKQDFQIDLPPLPPPEDFAAEDLEKYFKQVAKKVNSLGWQVEASTHLGLFSFHKLAIYQDLLSNAEAVRGNQIIQGLAGKPLDREKLEPIPNPSEIDKIQKPAETFQILDADSSQQQAIEAALRGHNIVLHGPPGTGKSQTIANIVAEFLARGKSVLFVSEKMAALEVVYNRLENVHLNEFCLELHSHKANKREVIQNLKEALDTKIAPQRLPQAEDFERLQNARKQLNDYVQELHRERSPLDRSVREVLVKLSELKDIPNVLWMGPAAGNLSVSWLTEKERAIKRLGTVWQVVKEGQDFLWYGYKEKVYDLSSRNLTDRLLNDCLQKLNVLQEIAARYAAELGLEVPRRLEDAEWLAAVGAHLNQSPAPDNSWLTTNQADNLAEEAAYYLELTENYWREYELFLADYAENCLLEFEPATSRLRETANNLQSMGIKLNDPDNDGVVEHRDHVVNFLEKTISFVTEAKKETTIILPTLNLPPKELDIQQLQEIAQLAEYLIELTESRDKPEISWFEPFAIDEVEKSIHRLQPLYEAYNEKKKAFQARRSKLLNQFDDSIFGLDLNQLIADFNSFIFRSPLRFVSPKFYRQKRAVLGASRSAALPATISEDLLEAREIVRLEAQLATEKPVAVPLWGRYDESNDTDFERLKDAVKKARELLRRTENAPTSAILNLMRQNAAPADFRRASERLQRLVDDITGTADPLFGVIAINPFYQTNTAFRDTPIDTIDEWAKNILPPMIFFRDSVNKFLRHQKHSNPISFAQLQEDLVCRERIQAAQKSIEIEGEKLGKKFGRRFRGLRTTWAEILTALEWTVKMRKLFHQKGIELAACDKFIGLCTNIGENTPPVTLFSNHLAQTKSAVTELNSRFYDPFPLGDSKPLLDCTFTEISEKLNQFLGGLDDLKLWADYREILAKLDEYSLLNFVEEFNKDGLVAEQLVPAFYKSFFLAWLNNLYQKEEVLRTFRTKNHETVIAEFQETDKRLVKLAAQTIIERCDNNRPDRSFLSAANSEEALLRREATKKKRHLPVRTLFQQMPNLLLKLKPCLMMSPLSVSQFLPSDKFSFDLLIFDEASQIFTEDAIGAIYRASQIIVAGDNKQMPPTDFFRAADTEVDEGESITDTSALNTSSSSDYSSVLDEIQTIDGVGVQNLRWHYRSRHESLIAFSNNRFYGDKLVTFPSAQEASSALGVHFVHVPDGIYDRGGKRDNQREAQVVADYVFEHFRKYPKKSLGVVAFSQAQMVAIEDELERRRIAQPSYEEFFKEDRLEGFFVKNLENVQGDERDVIFFSVGYGKDAQGKLTMNFGPLNRDGGERRLNVAVTRAREKVLLISSITAADISLTDASSSGVLNFHRYLDYAQRGITALSLQAPQGLGEADSPLEEDIASEIKRLGFDVVPQVGCSGYRIDMGVIDPAQPGKFILGIEADGATYHSAYTARDRDRLRQQVLENLGWRIHRIWSPDWFTQRQTEITRLKEVLFDAKNNNNSFFLSQNDNLEDAAAAAAAAAAASSSSSAIIKYQRENKELEYPPEVVDYRMTEVKGGAYYGRDYHAETSLRVQMDLLEQIVAIESPIHIELAARRLINGWWLEKVTERVISTTWKIARNCERLQVLQIKGNFLWSPKRWEKVNDLLNLPVRIPNVNSPETKRDIKFIAPEEIQAAVLLILRYALSIDIESLITETRKLFGFSRSGDNIRDRLLGELKVLESRNLIQTIDGKVSKSKN